MNEFSLEEFYPRDKTPVPQAKPVGSPAVSEFSLEDVYKDQGFFSEVGKVLSTTDWRNNLFVRGAEIANETLGYQTEIQNSQDWLAETAKMRKEHPEYDAMQSHAHMQEWLSSKVSERFKAARPHQPEEESQGVAEMTKQLVNAAYEHPGLVVGEVLKGVAEDPELLLPMNWEFGLAKIATNVGRGLKAAEGVTTAAGAVARTAEAGAGMAAIQVPISATEQLSKTGEVNPQKVAQEAAVAVSYRIGNSEVEVESATWSLMTSVDDKTSVDVDTFYEHEYEADDVGDFTFFQIMIQMRSQSCTKAPVIKQFRTLALGT